MLLVLITLIFGCLLALWLKYYALHYHVHMRGIKGPPPIPIIGSHLIFQFKDTTSPITLASREHKRYGSVMKVLIAFTTVVSIADRELLEYLLSSTKHITKGIIYTFLDDWLRAGLLTGTGKKWRKRRKICMPAFHFQILSEFTNVFHTNGDILVKQLECEVDKGSTDIYGYITLCALDIICETSMGTSINAQLNKDNEYVRSVKKMCQIIVARTMNPLLQIPFIYKMTKIYRDEQKQLQILHGYTNSVIASRQETLQNQKDQETESDHIGLKKRVAFLDLLLQSTVDGKPLNDDDIREEVNTLMFAGHDTTTSAMSFALYLIANHPIVQEKILEEHKSLFGLDPDRVLSINDLQEMKYLEAVIKETLRLYPSVPFYARQLTEELKYSDDICLPKDTLILISVFIMHRDPKYYPDPEKFLPERFHGSDGPKPYTYLPFSAGPRNCIGQKFAMLEMKSIISKVLLHYELRPVVPAHKLVLISETTLKSANGILISIKRRKTR